MSHIADAPPDMEYAHPGAPDRYTPQDMADPFADPFAEPSAAYDLRTVDQRRHDEIAALTRQMSQISRLTITLAASVRRLSADTTQHAAEIAELRARLDHQEATD